MNFKKFKRKIAAVLGISLLTLSLAGCGEEILLTPVTSAEYSGYTVSDTAAVTFDQFELSLEEEGEGDDIESSLVIKNNSDKEINNFGVTGLDEFGRASDYSVTEPIAPGGEARVTKSMHIADSVDDMNIYMTSYTADDERIKYDHNLNKYIIEDKDGESEVERELVERKEVESLDEFKDNFPEMTFEKAEDDENIIMATAKNNTKTPMTEISAMNSDSNTTLFRTGYALLPGEERTIAMKNFGKDESDFDITDISAEYLNMNATRTLEAYGSSAFTEEQGKTFLTTSTILNPVTASAELLLTEEFVESIKNLKVNLKEEDSYMIAEVENTLDKEIAGIEIYFSDKGDKDFGAAASSNGGIPAGETSKPFAVLDISSPENAEVKKIIVDVVNDEGKIYSIEYDYNIEEFLK